VLSFDLTNWNARSNGYMHLLGITGRPSVVRLPEWLPIAKRAHPSALYYLYFGSHVDHYIRMAWSSRVDGPYTNFNVDKGDSRVNGAGVLDLGPKRQIKFLYRGTKSSNQGNETFTFGHHISSPQVAVDNSTKSFRMYFHARMGEWVCDPDVRRMSCGKRCAGPFETDTQQTLVATSGTGLNFNNPSTSSIIGGVGGGEAGHGIVPAVLGYAYFQPFRWKGELFAFSNHGMLWKAPNPSVPWARARSSTAGKHAASQLVWARGPNPIFSDHHGDYNRSAPPYLPAPSQWESAGPRHFATAVVGGRLEVWYT
jgi:hypothetical protein